jgi:cytochrome b pre-mRNA-processing protein 3
MIFRLFGKRRDTAPIERLYAHVVEAARDPQLFTMCQVPDSVVGRFESLALHMALTLRRLRELPAPANDVAQDLVDRFFADMDSSLRELGIGDLSIPKKIKKLAQDFYGRAGAYDAALAPDAPPGALRKALARNLLGRADDHEAAAAAEAHVRAQIDRMAAADLETLLAGTAFAVTSAP